MGWKNVKEHYRIGHSVHITDEGLCIGSSYVHDLIVVSLEGVVVKRWDGSNEDLRRYLREFDADQAKLRRLIESPDEFSTSIPVYTYEGAEIIEKQCEEPGWPNVTHDGCLMHDNAFSNNKDTVVKWAKQNATAGASMTKDTVSRLREQLTEVERDLAQCHADLATLNATYPKGDDD